MRKMQQETLLRRLRGERPAEHPHRHLHGIDTAAFVDIETPSLPDFSHRPVLTTHKDIIAAICKHNHKKSQQTQQSYLNNFLHSIYSTDYTLPEQPAEQLYNQEYSQAEKEYPQ